jgi:hypothetical protein
MTYLDLARKWRHNKIMLRAIYRAYIRDVKRRWSAQNTAS